MPSPSCSTRVRVLAALVLLGGSATQACGALIWSEAVNGQLSSDPLNPTPLNFLPGSNQVIGFSAGSNTPPSPMLSPFADIFSFTVPVGHRLTAINIISVLDMPATSTTRALAFVAIQAGPQITSTSSGAALLGSTLFGSGSTVPHFPGTGEDLLPALAGPPTLLAGGGSGFTPPLGPGTYSFWIQEGNGAVSWNLVFQVDSIPEPATLLTFGLCVLGVCWYARRHASRRVIA